MTPQIRLAVPADVPALLEIELASFSQPSWSAEDFIADHCLVAEMTGRVAGFLVTRQVFPGDGESPPEFEILNLAVSPVFRRRGIASALLREGMHCDATYFLEVRESNVAAQTLYKTLGFIEISRRPNYYRQPPETAIVMQVKRC